MTEINIENIVSIVKGEVTEKQTKRNKRREEWCNKESKHFVKTYTVKTSYEEQKVCNAHGKESIVSVPYVDDKHIIEVITANEPQDIKNTIHWFNNSYLFSTDNGAIYNIHSKPRPMTDKEKTKVNTWRTELKEEEAEVNELKEISKTLRKAYVEKDKAVLEDGATMMLLLEYPNGNSKFHEGLKAREELDNLVTKYGSNEALIEHIKKDVDNQEYYNNLFNKVLQVSSRNNRVWQHIETTNKRSKDLEEKKKKVTAEIKAIYKKCSNEPLYEIHRMNVTSQVTVYVSSHDIEMYKGLGYKVYKKNTKNECMKWNEFNLDYIKEDYIKESHYFVMNKKAFITSCIHGKVAQNGYYYNENGEPVIIEKGKLEDTSVTVSVNGIPSYYNSLREAAKKLNIHMEVLRRCDKDNNGLILYVTNKGVTLVDNDGNNHYFKNKAEIAKTLDTSKKTISVAFKNKTVGDNVTICGMDYIITSL